MDGARQSREGGSKRKSERARWSVGGLRQRDREGGEAEFGLGRKPGGRIIWTF